MSEEATREAIKKAIFETIMDIAEKKRKEAIERGDYGEALVTAMVKNIFETAAKGESRQGEW